MEQLINIFMINVSVNNWNQNYLLLPLKTVTVKKVD